MQVLRKGQWWSIFSVHFPHDEQWCERSGFQLWHFWQYLYEPSRFDSRAIQPRGSSWGSEGGEGWGCVSVCVCGWRSLSSSGCGVPSIMNSFWTCWNDFGWTSELDNVGIECAWWAEDDGMTMEVDSITEWWLKDEWSFFCSLYIWLVRQRYGYKRANLSRASRIRNDSSVEAQTHEYE